MASSLQIVIEGVNDTDAAFGAVGKNMSALQSNSQNLVSKGLEPLRSMLATGLKVAAGVAVGAIGALGAGLVSSIKGAGDFEQHLVDVSAAMGANAEQTSKLKDLILSLGIDPHLKVDATEAAEAIGQLGTAGIAIPDILDGAARSTVLLANATGADFTQAANIASDAMHLWGISAKDLQKAVDNITATTIASKFTINDYALALAQGGGVAATVGVGFEDFNTSIAAMSSFFSSGSDAGTSFKVMLQNLVPKSDKAEDAMKGLGIVTTDTTAAAKKLSELIGRDVAPNFQDMDKGLQELSKQTGVAKQSMGAFLAPFSHNQFFDANGQLKSMADITEVLHNALSGLSEEQKNEALHTIFGTDAMRAAAAMSRLTKADFEALQKTMAQTSATDNAAKRMDTFKGSLEILQGTIQTLQISVGDKFLPVLKALIDRFNVFLAASAPKIVEWAGSLADKLKDLVDRYLPMFLDGLGGWVSYGKSVAESLFAMSGKLWDFILNAKAAIKPVLDFVIAHVSLKDALLAGAGIIAAIVLPALINFVSTVSSMMSIINSSVVAVMALKNAWATNFGNIRDITQTVMDYLQSRFGLLVSVLRDYGGGALQEIIKWATGTQTQFKNLSFIWEVAKSTIQLLFSDIQKYVSDNLPIWQAKLLSWGNAAWEWIKNATPLATQWLGNYALALWKWISDNAPLWVQKLAPWGIALFQWIGNAVPGAIDALTKWVDAMLGWGTTTGTTKTQTLMAQLGTAMLTALGKIGLSLANLALTVATDLLLSLAKGLLNWMGINVSLQSLHDTIIGFFDRTKTALGEKAALIGGIVALMLTPGFLAVVGTIVGTVIPAVISLATTIGGGLLSALGALGTMLTGGAVPAIGAFLAALGGIGLIVAAAVVAAVALYVAWNTNFLGIRDVTYKIIGEVKSLIAGIPSFFSGIADGFVSAKNTVINAVADVMNSTVATFNTLKDSVKTHFYSVAQTIIWSLRDGFNSASSTATGAINSVMTSVSAAVDSAAGLKTKMLSAGQGLTSSLRDGINSYSADAIVALQNIIGNIGTTVSTLLAQGSPIFNHLKTKGGEIVNVLYSGLATAGGDGAGAISSAFRSVIDWVNTNFDNGGAIFNHLFTKGKEIGAAILTGLAQGVQSMLSAVVDYVGSVAGNIVDRMKNVLGIASPSKVLRELGQNTMEGFNLGLQDMIQAPQLTMENAAAGVIAGAASGGGGNVDRSTNTTHNWNVTVPTSGGGAANEQMQSLFNTLTNVYAT